MNLDNLLNPIRNNLRENLWHIINNEPIDVFKFREYLEALLIKTQRKIVSHDYSFISFYANSLQSFYVEILDYINNVAFKGDVFKMEKFIGTKVNGIFIKTINDFLKEYDENY